MDFIRKSALASLVSRKLSLHSSKTSPELSIIDPNAEECPRFRVLVIGPRGSGKMSLIEAIFEPSLGDVQRGTTDINQEITSQFNERLAVHYSHDDVLRSGEEFGILKNFVAWRNQKKPVAERLHAIWICIATPPSDDLILDKGIFKMIQKHVPIIVVFTKFDLFVSQMAKQGRQNGESIQEFAEKEFQKRYGQKFEASIKSGSGGIPYTFVAISQPETLQRLVNITMRSIFNANSKNDRQATLPEDISYTAQVALAAAQRVDIQAKVASSIKIGGKTWNAITSDKHFFDITLDKRVRAIHKEIATIWSLDEFLLSDAFRCRMMSIVEDPDRNGTDISTTQLELTVASGVGGGWTKNANQGRSEYIMRYLVDLILILQAVFQIFLRFKGKVTPDSVNEIVYEFVCSERMEMVHNTITAIVRDQPSPASNTMMSKVNALLKENEITEKDVQFFQTRPPLPSLLTILRVESSPLNAINHITIDFMIKLSESDLSRLSVVSALETASDVALFLDFTLCVLRNGSLKDRGIEDANSKARRLLDKLSKKNVLPKTLFISDVKTDLSTIGVGGFGSVFQGEHRGQPVALKVLYKARNIEDSLRTDFCREALAWWSLSHKFILPLLGIYETKSHLFLVSPYMTNGTLFQWRQNHWPGEIEIRRIMFEVALGLQYIHSQGIVHGDLSAADVLLDSEFHCRITDFGLTRHIESTLSPSIAAISVNYAAPELVGMCTLCYQTQCDGSGCPGENKGKTTQTDVYAFGCIYYTVFFGTMPFQGETLYRIIPYILNGKRPSRLDSPKMDDDTWNLVQQCWSHNPSGRPSMDEIVTSHMTRPASLLTTLIIELKALGESMVNPHTIDCMRKLLDLPEFDSITSQLRITSDVQLLLDFILQVRRSLHESYLRLCTIFSFI
ncbi:kinase-like domain-containing protein [Amanita rubescens]|nr:kinase-like domain-containing protein [Amanita rubescens]